MDYKVKDGELDVDPGNAGLQWVTHQKSVWSQRHNTHLWDSVAELMQRVHQQALSCTEVTHTSFQLGPN